MVKKSTRVLLISAILLCFGTTFSFAIVPASAVVTLHSENWFQSTYSSTAYPQSGYSVGGIFPGWFTYNVWVMVEKMDHVSMVGISFTEVNGLDPYARFLEVYVNGYLVSSTVVTPGILNGVMGTVYWGWFQWLTITFKLRCGTWQGYYGGGYVLGQPVPIGYYNSWYWIEAPPIP